MENAFNNEDLEKQIAFLKQTKEQRKHIMYLNDLIHKKVCANYEQFCALMDERIPIELQYTNGNQFVGSVREWAKAVAGEIKNKTNVNWYGIFQEYYFNS